MLVAYASERQQAVRKVSIKSSNPLQQLYDQRLKGQVKIAPFVLRITEWKDTPIPVLVIKERTGRDAKALNSKSEGLTDRGNLKGDPLRRVLPILKKATSRIVDAAGVPLEVAQFMSPDGMKMRLNLPLDEEAGAKLALIFRLQERVDSLDRVELLARRSLKFSREEALYWLSRTTDFGPDANRWATSGLRLLLAGQPGDKAVERMLEKLRDD